MGSHVYKSQPHVVERNRIVEQGQTLTMPSPPPVFEEDDDDSQTPLVDDGDDAWAGTRMAPPLDLQVDDIRVKAEQLTLQQAAQAQSANSLGQRIAVGWRNIRRRWQ